MGGSNSDRRSLVFVITVGVIAGMCLQLHWFFASETMDVSGAMLFLYLVVTGQVVAMLFWVVWQVMRRVVMCMQISEVAKSDM